MPINRGALLAIYGGLKESRQRQEKLEDDRRDFEERLRIAGIEGALKTGEAGYDIQSGRFEPRTPTPFDRSVLGPGEQAHVPMPGGGWRSYEGPEKTNAGLVEPSEPDRGPNLLERIGGLFNRQPTSTPIAPVPSTQPEMMTGGYLRVRRKTDGVTGRVPIGEYDPTLYDKL